MEAAYIYIFVFCMCFACKNTLFQIILNSFDVYQYARMMRTKVLGKVTYTYYADMFFIL